MKKELPDEKTMLEALEEARLMNSLQEKCLKWLTLLLTILKNVWQSSALKHHKNMDNK